MTKDYTDLTDKEKEEKLKEHLLANFADGDSWEEADALSLSKHGALDVAGYFYELGTTQKNSLIERIEGMKMPELGWHDRPFYGTAAVRNRTRNYNAALDDVLKIVREEV